MDPDLTAREPPLPPNGVRSSGTRRLLDRVGLGGALGAFRREAEIWRFWRRRRGRRRARAVAPLDRGPFAVPAPPPESPAPSRHRESTPRSGWFAHRTRGGFLALGGSLVLHLFALALVLLRMDRPEERGAPGLPPSPFALAYRPPPPPAEPEPLAPPPIPPLPPPPEPEPSAEANPEPAVTPDPTPRSPEPAPEDEATDSRASMVRVPSFVSAPPIGAGSASAPVRLREPRPGGAFSSRGAGRLDALRRFGGDGGTEDAVLRGLRWLAAHQDLDGSFRAAGFQQHCGHFEACPGEGLSDFDTGVTALAALAFLGAGHGPDRPGPFQHAVARTLDALRAEQDPRGAIGVRGDKYLYNHAIATLALLEAAHLQVDERLVESSRKALRFLLDAQQPSGGWDYIPEATGRNDLSVSGWAILALHAARAVGHTVPPSAWVNARHFLDRAFTSSGDGIYANKDPEAGRRGANMIAVALLSHLLLDGAPDEPRARRAAARLLRDHPPQIRLLSDWDRSFQSYYCWYSATLALFHLGEPSWRAWNELLKDALLPLQSRQAHRDGSWDPEPSWIGKSGGRVYSTAMNVLTLEVYYRYPPLFSHERP